MRTKLVLRAAAAAVGRAWRAARRVDERRREAIVCLWLLCWLGVNGKEEERRVKLDKKEAEEENNRVDAVNDVKNCLIGGGGLSTVKGQEHAPAQANWQSSETCPSFVIPDRR